MYSKYLLNELRNGACRYDSLIVFILEANLCSVTTVHQTYCLFFFILFSLSDALEHTRQGLLALRSDGPDLFCSVDGLADPRGVRVADWIRKDICACA